MHPDNSMPAKKIGGHLNTKRVRQDLSLVNLPEPIWNELSGSFA
jgi:hypothetical protein